MKIGIVEILTIVFIILKLTQVINWSWWWVFSPVFIIFGLILLYYAITKIIYHYKRK